MSNPMFYRPVTQAECDHANTLRDYERAHKVWMNTSIFDSKAVQDEARRNLDHTRHEYLNAVKAAHPTWGVM